MKINETAKPEWLANINPAVVVLLVVPITHFVRRFKAENSITIALLIITISAFSITLSPAVEAAAGSHHVTLFGSVTLHAITLMVIIGIGLQGIAECFLSPKFMEFASKQAPQGEVGLYMGYMHLSSFFAYLFGFIISGYLLDWYCPDPNRLPEAVQQQRELALTTEAAMPPEYAHAHHIWYIFSAIGFLAFLALLVFKLVTGAIDKRRAAAGKTAS